MRTAYPRCWALLALAVIVGCKNDNTGPSPAPGPPVTTNLTCQQPNGQVIDCGLPLPFRGSFSLVVNSTSCEATTDSLKVTSPVDSLLTGDICHLPNGTSWTFGPYDPPTELKLQVVSQTFAHPPSLRATTGPGANQWTITFEDGADTDFNDLILQVSAVAAP